SANPSSRCPPNSALIDGAVDPSSKRWSSKASSSAVTSSISSRCTVAFRRVESERKMGATMERDWHRRALVEIVGTFALIFVGAGTIVETGGKDLVAIALAHGLAIGVMVAAVGHISGGVYNP